MRSSDTTIHANDMRWNLRSGIAVDPGSVGHVISENTALNNANPGFMDADLRDDNPECADNTWQDNTFDTRIVDGGSGDQTCIE